MVDVVTGIRERVEDMKTRLESGFKQPHDMIELAGLLHELLVWVEDTHQDKGTDEPENGPAAPSDGQQQAETTQDGPA